MSCWLSTPPERWPAFSRPSPATRGSRSRAPSGSRAGSECWRLGPRPSRDASSLAASLAPASHGVHGYFAHQPAAVAAAAAAALGVPYGFSAHALDARKVPAAELRRAGARAPLRGRLQRRRRRAGRAPRDPPGAGAARRRPRPLPAHARRRPAASALRLLAVGRLVEKKGFDVLVEAIARLDGAASLRIVGEGPQRARLEARDRRRPGWAGRVELAGARTHDRPAGRVRAPPTSSSCRRWSTPSGDRDGLPNVVLEAMASGRPVVASDVGAISSAVVDGVTGLLVPPGDPARLREALDGARALAPACAGGSEPRGRAVAESAVRPRRLHRGACADVLGRAYA